MLYERRGGRKRRFKMGITIKKFIAAVLLFILCFCLQGCGLQTGDNWVGLFGQSENTQEAGPESDAPKQPDKPNASADTKADSAGITNAAASKPQIKLSDIPPYCGRPYVAINGNVPYFTEGELSTTSYEYYSELDSLGRCGVCAASIGQDIMPKEERGAIGNVKPTGWHTVKYAGIVDGNYLYNRCHLIAFQLAGENDNKRNLITGTRYMNTEGMLPFENMAADYVKSSANHVMYRVTPMFEGNNLVAAGVLIEARSVEDNGRGVCFNVFCYNVQPGISIDYATGESAESAEDKGGILPSGEDVNATAKEVYAVNKSNGKIHIVGKCPATGTDSSAIKNPAYFDTYDEAEAYSIIVKPSQKSRNCGNCW